jgi:prepilin-type processing-associated H-X9-DG protein
VHAALNTQLVGVTFPTDPMRINLTAVAHRRNEFICPSESRPTEATYSDSTAGISARITLTNYYAVVGSPFAFPSYLQGFVRYHLPTTNPTQPHEQPPPSVSMKHVSDGTTHTLFALERTSHSLGGSPSFRYSVGAPWFTGAPYETVMGSFAWDLAVNLAEDGKNFYVAAPALSPQYGVNPQFRGSPLAKFFPTRSASSFHPGGANGLMADGSVHFLSESVDQRILNGLTTLAQGDRADGF